MIEPALQATALTWLFFALTILAWAYSYRLTGTREERSMLGWRTVPLSIFGCAWIAFAVTYLLRFLALAYDPELFRATQYPLWFMPGDRLTGIWLHIFVFWVLFCLGYIIASRMLATRNLRFFERLNLFESTKSLPVLDLFSVISLLLIILIYRFGDFVPRVILTPLGHLSQLCVLPPAIAWYWYFSGRPVGMKRYLYLVPIIVLYFLSPYREHIFKLIACIFLPFIATRDKIRLHRVLAFGIAALLLLTMLNQAYRSFLWEGETIEASAKLVSVKDWVDDPQKTPWVQASNRFHGFDSTALSIYFVPELTPFDDRNVILELMKIVIPRFIYGEKEDLQRGRLFSSEVWSYDEQEKISERGWAMIAPSMIGDLWISNGLTSILLGALIFGLLVGILENCRKVLKLGPSLAFMTLFFFLIMGAIERDFTNGVGVIIQITIILILVSIVLPSSKYEDNTLD